MGPFASTVRPIRLSPLISTNRMEHEISRERRPPASPGPLAQGCCPHDLFGKCKGKAAAWPRGADGGGRRATQLRMPVYFTLVPEVPAATPWPPPAPHSSLPNLLRQTTKNKNTTKTVNPKHTKNPQKPNQQKTNTPTTKQPKTTLHTKQTRTAHQHTYTTTPTTHRQNTQNTKKTCKHPHKRSRNHPIESTRRESQNTNKFHNHKTIRNNHKRQQPPYKIKTPHTKQQRTTQKPKAGKETAKT